MRNKCSDTSTLLEVISFPRLLWLQSGASQTCAGRVDSAYKLAQLACSYQPNANTSPNSAFRCNFPRGYHRRFSSDSAVWAQSLPFCPAVLATTKISRFFFSRDFMQCLPSGHTLTRCLWRQANLVPSQMPAEEEKQACRTRSGHQSAAAAPHRSCSSGHSTSPWDHLPDYPELKESHF